MNVEHLQIAHGPLAGYYTTDQVAAKMNMTAFQVLNDIDETRTIGSIGLTPQQVLGIAPVLLHRRTIPLPVARLDRAGGPFLWDREAFDRWHAHFVAQGSVAELLRSLEIECKNGTGPKEGS